jgi:hypothetical protein
VVVRCSPMGGSDRPKDSYYLYLMQSSIGRAIRAEYEAVEASPLPEKLAKLVARLDGRENRDGTAPVSHDAGHNA